MTTFGKYNLQKTKNSKLNYHLWWMEFGMNELLTIGTGLTPSSVSLALTCFEISSKVGMQYFLKRCGDRFSACDSKTCNNWKGKETGYQMPRKSSNEMELRFT